MPQDHVFTVDVSNISRTDNQSTTSSFALDSSQASVKLTRKRRKKKSTGSPTIQFHNASHSSTTIEWMHESTPSFAHGGLLTPQTPSNFVESGPSIQHVAEFEKSSPVSNDWEMRYLSLEHISSSLHNLTLYFDVEI